jgi:hypothetical protein
MLLTCHYNIIQKKSQSRERKKKKKKSVEAINL